MAAAVCRGARTMNSVYLKPMLLRKGYHKKSDVVVVVKLNGEERKTTTKRPDDGNWWIRDDRTGIYYPKGQEKIMEDVPLRAGKDFEVNWFNFEPCMKIVFK